MWLLLFLFFSFNAYATVENPCLDTEHWKTNHLSDRWVKRFHEFTAGRISPALAFSEALNLKQISSLRRVPGLEEDFAEYWIGRIFFNLKIHPFAAQALQSVWTSTHDPDLRKAVYSCLHRIESHYPDLNAPPFPKNETLPWDENDSEVIARALIRDRSNFSERISSLLHPRHLALVNGLKASMNRNYSATIESLRSYLNLSMVSGNDPLLPFQDEAHLLLGRALYSVARFREAQDEFQKVKKTSNLQIEALQNLAWAYLLQGKHDDAIGISLQLRGGALHNTFSPEASMVSAMALNELCLYPESIRTMRTFAQDYQGTFEWLRSHEKSESGYSITLQALQEQSGAPKKLETEWIRQPAFLTRQMEMNEINRDPARILEVETQALKDQQARSRAILKDLVQFLSSVKKLKIEDRIQRFGSLRKDLRALARFQVAAKAWKRVSKLYVRGIPSFKKRWIKHYDDFFNRHNRDLLATLRTIRDNSELIEIEILNGASKDLVWKSAHPEFKPGIRENAEPKPERNPAETWSWGRFQAADLENTELWEDELGALKADVTNQCKEKRRFMKLHVLKESS